MLLALASLVLLFSYFSELDIYNATNLKYILANTLTFKFELKHSVNIIFNKLSLRLGDGAVGAAASADHAVSWHPSGGAANRAWAWWRGVASVAASGLRATTAPAARGPTVGCAIGSDAQRPQPATPRH